MNARNLNKYKWPIHTPEILRGKNCAVLGFGISEFGLNTPSAIHDLVIFCSPVERVFYCNVHLNDVIQIQ
jgi:hypothetical protein